MDSLIKNTNKHYILEKTLMQLFLVLVKGGGGIPDSLVKKIYPMLF